MSLRHLGPAPPRRNGRNAVLTARRGLSLAVIAGLSAASLAGVSLFERSVGGSSTSRHLAMLDLRDAPLTGAAMRLREFASLPVAEINPSRRPMIAVIIDDLGVDKAGLARALSLPGPLTLSFLPYAPNVQADVDRAAVAGHEIMLHLPMEPAGRADPGPDSLRVAAGEQALDERLRRNLARFEGYVGVNNHMGSRFTARADLMRKVIGELDRRGLYFVDSLTTGDSAAQTAAAELGATILVRDVFIDAEPGRAAIAAQLRLAETIARETGSAIAIAHPRNDTLDTLSLWLATAPARGIDIVTVSDVYAVRVRPPLRTAMNAGPSG